MQHCSDLDFDFQSLCLSFNYGECCMTTIQPIIEYIQQCVSSGFWSVHCIMLVSVGFILCVLWCTLGVLTHSLDVK